MEDMKSFDEQMPCVGIFWYDPEDNTLFGVRKKELTPQMVEEAVRWLKRLPRRASRSSTIRSCIGRCGQRSISVLRQSTWIPSSRATTRRCPVAEWRGLLISSSCWWASGPSRFRRSSPSCWSKSSRCRTSSSCTTSTGTWATVGVVICQSKCLDINLMNSRKYLNTSDIQVWCHLSSLFHLP